MLIDHSLSSMVLFLANKEEELPILSDTYTKIDALFKAKEYDISFFELTDIILQDPFLSLKILFKISKRKRTDLSLEVDSIKKTIMLLGLTETLNIVFQSSVLVPHPGLSIAIKRCRYAADKVKLFSIERKDILPEEVQLATLLADLGELILWVFIPKLPEQIREAMINQQFSRNQQAQLQLCGFKFKDLSYQLAKEWYLPVPIIELMDDTYSIRSCLSKACINVSRHLNEYKGYLAIPDDIKELAKLLGHSKEHILMELDIKGFVSQEEFEYINRHIHNFI